MSLTIALTRYNEPNDLLWACLRSLSEQRGVRVRILMLDQVDCAQTRYLCESLSQGSLVFEWRRLSVGGCSEARNTAVNLCESDILLWTDPDVVVGPDWARTLSDVLTADQADIVGGKILPCWQVRPRWYMKSNVMADHYSLIDLGDETRPTDRIIGGSMALHVGRLGRHARFDERLGRQGGTLLGGVDAEFCERATANGFRVQYVGSALAQHQIPIERTRLKWIAKKFYYGGLSRGMRGGAPRPMTRAGNVSDYIVLACFSPFYLAGFWSAKRRQRKSCLCP